MACWSTPSVRSQNMNNNTILSNISERRTYQMIISWKRTICLLHEITGKLCGIFFKKFERFFWSISIIYEKVRYQRCKKPDVQENILMQPSVLRNTFSRLANSSLYQLICFFVKFFISTQFLHYWMKLIYIKRISSTCPWWNTNFRNIRDR